MPIGRYPADKHPRLPDRAARIMRHRSVETAKRYLTPLLRPGTSLLDVGCGRGDMAREAALAVGPEGHVVGLDTDMTLLAEAYDAHGTVENLSFVAGDPYLLPYDAEFDFVASSHTLQWVREPARVIQQLLKATRPGGTVLVMDYNHLKTKWEPAVPAAFRRFHRAFLQWRSDNAFNNAIADELPQLLQAAGLEDIAVTELHEVSRRGDADFDLAISLWAEVAATRGHQLVRAGYLRESERAQAESSFRHWATAFAQTQTMYVLAVKGRRPH